MYLLKQMPQIIAEKDSYHIVETIQFMLFAVSLRYNAACCIPLRHLRNLRENKHASVLNQSTQKKPQCLPLISQIYADKQQNRKTSPNCLSLRNNAACCIPLRHLRYLRENTHPNLLNQSTQKKTPMSPADPADLRRRTTITFKYNLCETNAACCISLQTFCAICVSQHSARKVFSMPLMS